MAKKKKSKLKLVKERTHLTEEEMLKLDNLNLTVKSIELKVKVLEMSFKEKVDKEIKELQKIREERREFNAKIKTEFGIEADHWGFDPLTGEVKK